MSTERTGWDQHQFEMLSEATGKAMKAMKAMDTDLLESPSYRDWLLVRSEFLLCVQAASDLRTALGKLSTTFCTSESGRDTVSVAEQAVKEYASMRADLNKVRDRLNRAKLEVNRLLGILQQS